jgi:hypothetical protein
MRTTFLEIRPGMKDRLQQTIEGLIDLLISSTLSRG